MRKLLCSIFILVVATVAVGQEVIMNQPSADIVGKGHVFVRADEFYTQSPAFYQENLNLAYGLGHNFELSLNNNNAFNRRPVPDSLVLGFKYAPLKTAHWELYIGDQFVQPLTHKIPGFSHGDTVYEAAAYSIGAFRLTGGLFESHNGVALGNRAGALAGVEWGGWKFKDGWAVAPGIDYATGGGTNGYLSPGLNFMKGNFFFSPGYMIGNAHNVNGAHQIFTMVGYTF